MLYIYMDESGCLGFDLTKHKTSKNFIITFLYTEHPRRIEKIIKKIFKGMSKTEQKACHGALHANKINDRTRKLLLSKLATIEEISILVIRLNKRKVYTHLRDEKTVLYNYVTNILIDRTLTRFKPKKVKLIASRRETNKFLNQNFKSYLENQNNGRVAIDVSIKTPSAEKCLQAVDFASWAVFKHYEHNDKTFYNLIDSIIKEDNPLFGQ